jgi:hypothetical protein
VRGSTGAWPSPKSHSWTKWVAGGHAAGRRVADPLGRAHRVGLGHLGRAVEELQDDVVECRVGVGEHVDGAHAVGRGDGERALLRVTAGVLRRERPRELRRRRRGRGGVARAVDHALAREDRAAARVHEHAVGGRLGCLGVDHQRLERRHEALRDRWEGHLTGLLHVADPGDAQALPATAEPLLAAQARDLGQRIDAADARGGRLPGLAVAQARAAPERPVAADGARGRDDLPGAPRLGHADRDQAAARGVQAADRLAQRDRVGRAAGQRVVRDELHARRRGQAEQRAVARQPRARRVGRVRALDRRAKRPAGPHERGRRAELVPADLRAEVAHVGALRGGGRELARSHVQVRQAAAVDPSRRPWD